MGWKTYARVAYLESSGTQYIDTGIAWDDLRDARVIIDTTVLGTSNWRMHGISGAGYGGPNVGLNGRSKLAFASDGDRESYVTGSVGIRYLFDLNLPAETFQVTRVDDNTLLVNMSNMSTKYYDATRTNFDLFGYSTGNSSAPTLFAFKLYSAKLYNKGTLVRDMVPVIDGNNVPCMFDYVSNQCFYNAGTGNFIVGNSF